MNQLFFMKLLNIDKNNIAIPSSNIYYTKKIAERIYKKLNFIDHMIVRCCLEHRPLRYYLGKHIDFNYPFIYEINTISRFNRLEYPSNYFIYRSETYYSIFHNNKSVKRGK